MDLKRIHQAKIQPPTQIKGSHFVNPLLNIANASTPVRTRVVKPSSQLNSTPANYNKIRAPSTSPALSNKGHDENYSKAAKKPRLGDKNINLSPIMALNRKMSEGPKLDRPLTPNGFRRQESMANFAAQESRNEYMFGQTLK